MTRPNKKWGWYWKHLAIEDLGAGPYEHWLDIVHDLDLWTDLRSVAPVTLDLYLFLIHMKLCGVLIEFAYKVPHGLLTKG